MAQDLVPFNLFYRIMTKRGTRNPATWNKKLRIRIALRTLEIWKQSGYLTSLERFALKAAKYLEQNPPSQPPLGDFLLVHSLGVGF